MKDTTIIIKNAVLIVFMIGGFFFFTKIFGLHENPFLRFFNLLFVGIGIRQAIKTNIKVNKETSYIINLGLGLQTSALAVLFSIVGVVSYVEFIDPDFLNAMDKSFLISGSLSLPELFITLLIEGMASSLIGSFIVMQFYKNHDKLLAKNLI